MNIRPDPTSLFVDPFASVPTVSFVCDVWDPVHQVRYNKDPRFIAAKAEAYMKSIRVADEVRVGPEPEFFVFDSVRYEQREGHAMYEVDGEEAPWNSGNTESGHTMQAKGGYFPTAPSDRHWALRNDIVLKMKDAGLNPENSHHEVSHLHSSTVLSFLSLTI